MPPAPAGDPGPGAAARVAGEIADARATLAALEDDFRRLVQATADANSDDEHDPEGATIGFERAQLTAAIERTRQRLTDLERAGARLADGSYGVCENCGRPIGMDRLVARPATRRCVRCA